MDKLLADDRADTVRHTELAAAITALDPERAAVVADRILTQALDAWSRLPAATYAAGGAS